LIPASTIQPAHPPDGEHIALEAGQHVRSEPSRSTRLPPAPWFETATKSRRQVCQQASREQVRPPIVLVWWSNADAARAGMNALALYMHPHFPTSAPGIQPSESRCVDACR
jgi:hypothetical protein